MSLKFEDNLVKDFDVQQTFGKLNYLSTQAIYESDSDGGRTEMVREQRMTVYSEAKGDQIDIALPANLSLSELQYDDEIELTGEVTALAWLSSYTGYNDSIQSEQAFKIRAEGVQKREISIPNKHVKEKQLKHN
ncbi:DUF961 family protein [Enterococcus faecalis]|uniref:DUF961 family protein n=1 Tax=Enterococcus faecalis TaxID=1351 RepID=UPI00189B4EED|nr:DUF961 family protein [Enterococcus faecalis]